MELVKGGWKPTNKTQRGTTLQLMGLMGITCGDIGGNLWGYSGGPMLNLKDKISIFILQQPNIAMENGPFIADLPIQITIFP